MASYSQDGGHDLFDAEKCCHQVSAHAASAQRPASNSVYSSRYSTSVHLQGGKSWNFEQKAVRKVS